ncbi:monocarboxylate transporter 1-like [Haliotis rubra]|uniref:monocarboxylate transporter 1-like n=1 Tax=Haliotis rubra TaxID=36100 RepID=UPI001EE5DBA4|nr:monocarboxylate transporter 1-like [Haliotis rubra]
MAMSNDHGDDDKGKSVKTEVKPPEDDNTTLPIDRGWAWAILGGCFLNALLTGGYNRSMALFFVEYLEMFGASTTETTLVLGVKAMTISLMSPIAMNVVLEFLGTRKTVLLGGLLNVLGILSATFAPNILVLICVHSVLTGMGNSMAHAPGIVLIGKYFKKRRGLATTAAGSAMSVAGVFPILTQYLLDEYGIRGTMLIYTGLTMNIFVGASLYRPLHFYERRVKPDRMQEDTVDSGGVEVRAVIRNEDATGAHHGGEDIHGGSTRSCNVVVNDTCNGFLDPQIDDDSFRKRAHSEGSKKIIKQSVSEFEKMVYTSNPDLVSLPIITPKQLDASERDIRVDDRNHRKSAIARNIRKVFKAFDFSLFKNPMFLLIVAFCLFGVVVRHIVTYLPAQMKEMGLSQSDAAFLLLISGILDFFCRLFYGFVADLGYLRVSRIMAFGLLIVGVASQFIMFYTTYPLLVAYCVVVGVFGCAVPCLFPLLIVDFMGIDCMAKTIGFTVLFQGFSAALTHPILGALRDLSGSYIPCFQYLGVSSFFSAALLLCEPLVRRYAAKHPQASPSKDEECLEPLKEANEVK